MVFLIVLVKKDRIQEAHLMAENKSILFPETENVAAPEPHSNAYDREGEGGEQEEAKHVSRGQWGTSCVSQEVHYDRTQDLFDISEDVGTKLLPLKHVSWGQGGTSHDLQEVYYDGVQDLFDISDDVGTNLSDQDQPSMGSVRSENGVKQGIVPLTDFKRKREPVVSNTIYLDTPIVNIDQDLVASNPICYDIHGKLVSERESDDERLVAQQESGDEKLVDGGESGGRGDCVRKLVADELVDKDTIILVAVKQKIASGSAQDFIAPHLICSNFYRKLLPTPCSLRLGKN